MPSPTLTSAAIHPLIAARHSPRSFAPTDVPSDALRRLFEAARWAPSSFNEQPWRLLVGVASRQGDDTHARILSCLAKPNQAWAQGAPVLMLTVASTAFARNDKPNRHALHDVGLAMGQLAVQASALGLMLHQMAGFDADQARELFDVPAGYEPVAAVALGYPASDDADSADGDASLRRRKPQQSFVFHERFGQALTMPDDYEQVLGFWFGTVSEDGTASKERSPFWYKKSEAFDEWLREQFGALHEALRTGQHDDWLATPRGRLGYIIVLDQFSRNMFRDSPGMYESDPLAVKAVQDGLALGHHKQLATTEHSFFLMPLMHSEDVAMQDLCVAELAALRDSLPPGPARKGIEGGHSYAVKHRDIVARFGRFPHRNKILGRPSTEEEQAFLKEPGSSF